MNFGNLGNANLGNLTPTQRYMLFQQQQQQRPVMMNQMQSDWRGAVSNATREDFIALMYLKLIRFKAICDTLPEPISQSDIEKYKKVAREYETREFVTANSQLVYVNNINNQVQTMASKKQSRPAMNQQRPPVRPISMAPNRAQQQMLMNPQLIQQYLMQTPRQFANQTPVVQTIPVRPQQRPPAENAAYIKSLQVKLSKLPQSQPDPSIQQKIKDMAKHKTVNCSYNKLPPQDEAKVIELLAILNVFYQHIDTLIYELYLLDQQKAEKMMQMKHLMSGQYQVLSKKIYCLNPTVCTQLLDYFKDCLEMVEKTEPVAVVAEVEDKFETKLQDIFNRDFGMDQVIDVDQMLAIESGMSPGFLEHSIQKKIQVPTMTESAFHLFGPCRLVSPLNIQPKRVFRDRWVRGQETKTESSLDQELALLASTHEITFSIEQIDSILSCIVSHGAQTLFMTIPSLEKYSSNSTESLIELDHAIGLSDLESEQINKLLSQGCTITKLVESIWKKTIQ